MNNVSCPYCGSYAVISTTAPIEGECEYLCDECGEYFVSEAEDE
jgi:transposase-like protein